MRVLCIFVLFAAFTVSAKGQSTIHPTCGAGVDSELGPSVGLIFQNYGPPAPAGIKFEVDLHTLNNSLGDLSPPILGASLVDANRQPLDQGRLQYTLSGHNNNRIHATVSVPGPVEGNVSIGSFGFIVLHFKEPRTEAIHVMYTCNIGANSYGLNGGVFGANALPPPEPAGAYVPTANEWQLLFFGVLLFAGAVFVARRNSRQS